MSEVLDVAIIGAGPYGLSIAANLKALGVAYQIFGKPMESWTHHMPKGMHLKSEGFASNLEDPSGFTLKGFSSEIGADYADIGLPVSLDHFVSYGEEFQRRFVKELDRRYVTLLRQEGGSYVLQLEDGVEVRAKQVVMPSESRISPSHPPCCKAFLPNL